MINILQAAIRGLIQGVTELFPISSLGHSVILLALFGWDLNQSNPSFRTFLIATHLATAIVLFLFFLNDWIEINPRAHGLKGDVHPSTAAPDTRRALPRARSP